ncbi:MAG: glycosyltransferase family 2 protein [Candidatus Peregrinibacteria bacterium]|nr:glycosyltransferase family 2 protein [Candidatus Peregrinibacteria bacterium]
MKTLVIIPALNEETRIASVLNDVRSQGFEDVLVVDDGSKDKTSEMATSLGAKVVKHQINLGVGAATQTGILWGVRNSFDYFLTIDGDGQQDAVDLKKIRKALEKADCVIGSRFLQKNKIPVFRRFANKVANIFTGLFFGVWVSDSQSGLRGFNRNVAEKLHLHGGGFEYCSEFIREVNDAGFDILEVPISVTYSIDSMQKGQNFAEGVSTFMKLFLKAISR